MSWEHQVCQEDHEPIVMDRLRSWQEDGVVYVEVRCPECGHQFTVDSNGGRSDGR